MLGRESSRVYIKSVTCAGFKSFGDTKQTFSFGPGLNLIAGCVHLSFSLNHLIRAPMLRILYLPRLIDSRPVLIKLRTVLTACPLSMLQVEMLSMVISPREWEFHQRGRLDNQDT